MVRALKGHFFVQMLQPLHSDSEMLAILSVGFTWMHNLPCLTTGHDRLHSWLHLLGLHLSVLTTAILVGVVVSCPFDFLSLLAMLGRFKIFGVGCLCVLVNSLVK